MTRKAHNLAWSPPSDRINEPMHTALAVLRDRRRIRKADLRPRELEQMLTFEKRLIIPEAGPPAADSSRLLPRRHAF